MILKQQELENKIKKGITKVLSKKYYREQTLDPVGVEANKKLSVTNCEFEVSE